MFREGTIYSSQCCNSINSDFLVNQYNYLSDNFDICVISACVCSSAITTSSGMQQCSNIAMQQCSICTCKNKFSNDMDNVGMCEHKIEDNRYKVTVYGLSMDDILHSVGNYDPLLHDHFTILVHCESRRSSEYLCEYVQSR